MFRWMKQVTELTHHPNSSADLFPFSHEPFLPVWYLYKHLQAYIHLAWGVNAHKSVLSKGLMEDKAIMHTDTQHTGP